MKTEKNNFENKQISRQKCETGNKSGGRKTAVILAVTLMAGIMAVCGGCNSTKTVDEQESTVSETEVTTEKVTVPETTKVSETSLTKTTTETTSETSETTPAVTEVTKSLDLLSKPAEKPEKRSPLGNENIIRYFDALEVITAIPNFYRLSGPYSNHNEEFANKAECIDIEIDTDDAHIFDDMPKSVRYLKVSDLGEEYPYKTAEDVWKALREYVTDSYIETHYISDYDDSPGRFTVFKIIDGELYVSSTTESYMIMGPWGCVYNYEGETCDVISLNDSENHHADFIKISLLLEDGKWKIDGYDHLNNSDDDTTLIYKDHSAYDDICNEGVKDLTTLEGVVLGFDVSTDKDDTLTEKSGDMTAVYQCVTDERFSNISEIENYICSYSVGDMRLRCIDYIRGVNRTFPVYKMSEGKLYCCKVKLEDYSYYRLEYEKAHVVISADDDYIHLGLDFYIGMHNSLFLKNTEDGWKICDLD